MCSTMRVLSGYYWEDSFPPFHLLYTQIQKTWKPATCCKNPLSRVQRNTGISTSAWAKSTLMLRIREDMQQDLRMVPDSGFKAISASHPPLKSGWKRRKQRSCRKNKSSSPAQNTRNWLHLLHEGKRNRLLGQKRMILAGVSFYFSPKTGIVCILCLSQHPTHLREQRSWGRLCFAECLHKNGLLHLHL